MYETGDALCAAKGQSTVQQKVNTSYSSDANHYHSAVLATSLHDVRSTSDRSAHERSADPTVHDRHAVFASSLIRINMQRDDDINAISVIVCGAHASVARTKWQSVGAA